MATTCRGAMIMFLIHIWEEDFDEVSDYTNDVVFQWINQESPEVIKLWIDGDR